MKRREKAGRRQPRQPNISTCKARSGTGEYRDRLQEAIQAVRRVGRKLGQKAMYFEVAGYDGVQILRI